jgi:peptide/nickel transport system ATP-binding protein
MFVSVRDLKVHFPAEEGLVRAVDGLSFSIERGKTLAIVGESGSGKTAASLAMLGLHGKSARISGEITIGDAQIVGASEATLRRLRGNRMAMIFQDPLTAMHPYHKVGVQIVEAYRTHRSVSRSAARQRTLDMLARVGMADARRAFDSYPHQLSGGQRQRVMIAMALCCDPELLIADEPTTALDVTVQAQILDLLKDLQREFGSAIIMITHDLGVVAEVADEVVVMYAGRAVETGTVRDVFYRPSHPYTWGLLESIPRLDHQRDRLTAIPGSPPSLAVLAEGCAFRQRCGHASAVADGLCASQAPLPIEIAAGHAIRCHLSEAGRAAARPNPRQPLQSGVQP